MPNQLQNVNLTTDSLHIGNIYDSLFLEDLNGNFLACEGVCAHLDFAEGALTYGLADEIVAYFLVIVCWLPRLYICFSDHCFI